MINKKRTHIVISEELAAAIDSTVGKRARSKFFSEVAWREIKRRRLLKRSEERRVGKECRL